MRALLASLSQADAQARSARVCRRVARIPQVQSAQWLMGFVSFGTEVHTHGLLRALLAEHRHVCVPSFDPTKQRYFCSELRHFDDELREGRWGILEPRREAIRPVPPENIDVWLVPGLAFDPRGNRLGRGIGHFDRLLCGARGVKIGLAYDFQLIEEVPSEPHDVRMDFIVTETRIENCRRTVP